MNIIQADDKNQTPQDLSNGLIQDRKCTDIFVCLAFVIFFLGMFATAAYGYAMGNPNKLITPFDSQGNQCGVGNISDYKYLYWP